MIARFSSTYLTMSVVVFSDRRTVRYPDDAQALCVAVTAPRDTKVEIYVKDTVSAVSCVESLGLTHITVKSIAEYTLESPADSHIDWLKAIVAKRGNPITALSEEEREVLKIIDIDYKAEALKKYPEARAMAFNILGSNDIDVIIACARVYSSAISGALGSARGDSLEKTTAAAWRNAYFNCN